MKEAEPTSLSEYVSRMPEGQASLYYVTGESRATAERSPHLEAFRARGYEVLFFVDPIDEFVAQSVPEFEGKPVVSVARAGVEPGTETERKAGRRGAQGTRGRDAPVPGVPRADAGGHDSRGARVVTPHHFARVPRRRRARPQPRPGTHASPGVRARTRATATKRILEVNDGHALVAKLRAMHAASPDDSALVDAAHLLLGTALLAEGAAPPDPAGFAARLAGFMTREL